MGVLFLKEIYKKKIWGSRFFKEEINQALEDVPIGEMWCVAAHPECDLVIEDGIYAGKTLSEVYRDGPALFNNPVSKKFPVVVKIIATADDLSIQVHPDNQYALKYENDSGKTEGWLILRTDDDAQIVYGHRAPNKEHLTALIAARRWSEFLNFV